MFERSGSVSSHHHEHSSLATSQQLPERPTRPHFPSSSLPLPAATAQLRRTIGEWVYAATLWTAPLGDAAPQPPRVGVAACAGLGKTRTALLTLASDWLAAERHWDYFTPRHNLADEFHHAFAEHRRSRGTDLRVLPIRGRSYRGSDGKPFCVKNDVADLLTRCGHRVSDTLCRRQEPNGNEERCEHYDHCPYIAQFADTAPAVRIWSHQHLVLPRPAGLPPADAAIIDEAFHQQLVGHASIALDRVTAPREWRFRADEDQQLIANLSTLSSDVRQALERGELPSIFPEQCLEAAELEARAVPEHGISPAQPLEEQRRLAAMLQHSEALTLSRFWKTLAHDVTMSRLQSIELRRDERTSSGALEDRLHLHWRKELRCRDIPTLLLDADLDERITRAILPGTKIHQIVVERAARVVQVTDTACSKRRMLGHSTAPEGEQRRAANRLHEVQLILNAEAAAGRRCLLVTYKEAADRLVAPPGSAVRWLGAIRGLDLYKSFDTVIIAGRLQPPAQGIESLARALFSDDEKPLAFTGSYRKEPRAFRMRDGQLVWVEVDVHPDPRCQAVLEQIREREIAQAVDRLRLIHRDHPARVIVLTNLALDLTVDDVSIWRDLRPDKLLQAWLRADGVLPLSDRDLAQRFPDLWPSGNAVKCWRREQAQKGVDSLIAVLLGKAPLFLARYRRLGQRGHASTAVIDAARQDPRAALEVIVGPVTEFSWVAMEPPHPAGVADPVRRATAEERPSDVPLRAGCTGSTSCKRARSDRSEQSMGNGQEVGLTWGRSDSKLIPSYPQLDATSVSVPT